MALGAAFEQAKRRYRAHKSTALDFLLLTRHAACAVVSHHRKDICSVQPHARNGIHVCSPERVCYWRKLVQEVKITRWDYEKVLLAPGDNVAVFLDPPYLLDDHNSPVYEYSWTLADHERLFRLLKDCPHRFLMTLHRSLWSMTLYQRTDFRTPFRARRRGFRVTSQGYHYSLQGHKTDARELIISNYD